MRFFSYLNYLAGQTSNSDESKSNDQNVDWSEIPKDTAPRRKQPLWTLRRSCVTLSWGLHAYCA